MEISSKPSANFTRLFDLIDYQRARYPNAQALNACINSQWVAESIETFRHRVDLISGYLLQKNYQRGEKIILVPDIGSADWMAIDLACQQIGLIPVPLHATVSEAELTIMLDETQACLCVVTFNQWDRIRKIFEKKTNVPALYHLSANHPGYFLGEIKENVSSEVLVTIENLKSSIDENDLATIMYTSGSSGEPKGVMLSHRNIVHNIKSVLTFFPVEPTDRVLSFLPFSHILERTTTYAYLAFGCSIYFSESRETFSRDFKQVRPHFCTCVPRVLEKMYDYLQQELLTRHVLKRKMIQWAIAVGLKYKEQERIGFPYYTQLILARLLVLRHWRHQLGGKIKYMAVGAAALRPEIARLLAAAGIHVVEGYGLTETAPLISINRFEPGMNRYGTVGLVIPGVEVKIEPLEQEAQGEILVKGPNVMLGYYLKPELNDTVFTHDGWFRTGDVGQWVHGHFLQITDRKKEIFKTSSGKYIAPLPLQNHFCESPYIQWCLVIGFQRPYVTALLLPNFLMLQSWCEQQNVHWTSPEFMVHNIKVKRLMDTEVERLNSSLQNFQRVRNYVLCPREWSADRGEITATLKPVRKVLEQHYRKEIEKMYAEGS